MHVIIILAKRKLGIFIDKHRQMLRQDTQQMLEDHELIKHRSNVTLFSITTDIRCFFVNGVNIQISHLKFVNDALFVGERSLVY